MTLLCCSKKLCVHLHQKRCSSAATIYGVNLHVFLQCVLYICLYFGSVNPLHTHRIYICFDLLFNVLPIVFVSSVFCLCFDIHYFVSILVLQSS